MTLSLQIVRGAIWTMGGHALLTGVRFGTNVVLARLLAPELFGIMVIVNSLRTGLELLSDVGIGQNIIYNRSGGDPAFYNTAWTIQAMRGAVLCVASAAAAWPLALFYGEPILFPVMAIMSIGFVISGLGSVSLFLLDRKMKVAQRNVFDSSIEVISAIIYVSFAIVSPTIWALVAGGLVSNLIRAAASHLLIKGLCHRFFLSHRYSSEILSFGKWIFISTVLYYGATNFDRLYLGKVLALQVVGVYGIARTMADMLGGSVVRLGNIVIFPVIAAASKTPRITLRKEIRVVRFLFVLAAAILIAVLAAVSDLMIELIYDFRYHDAGWMLSILLLGTWISIICTANEAFLLGFGKPQYGAAGNALKVGFLVAALPVAIIQGGLVAGLIVIAASDVFRYVSVFVGQAREGFTFALQDLAATALLGGILGALEVARWYYGWGVSFGPVLGGD